MITSRRAVSVMAAGQSVKSTQSKPLVSIIMGSDSDLPVMCEAAKVLEEFGISYHISIVSAHRTPARVAEYAEQAEKMGGKVIIAGAGGAAHLPGMTASETHLPVIGVPVKGSSLEGMDSLLSIVQMPRGIPVATVAINNARNAGILAAQILGVGDEVIAKKIRKFKEDLKNEVLTKAVKLEKEGYEKYMKSNS